MANLTLGNQLNIGYFTFFESNPSNHQADRKNLKCPGKPRKPPYNTMSLSKEELTRHIGSRIRAHRNGRNLTIEDLAIAAEMEYTQLSRIERGKINTGIFHIYKIAGSLGIPMHELLSGLPTPQRKQPVPPKSKTQNNRQPKVPRNQPPKKES
jgi:transcriptional regulator with XRE-family HTH domain